MDFRDCTDCGEYKYIERDGKCPACLSDAETTTAEGTPASNTSPSTSTPQPSTGPIPLVQDVVSRTIRTNPNVWHAIGDGLDDPRITLVSGPPTTPKDELDFGPDAVRLYKAGEEFCYADYQGSQSDRVRAALDDALDRAVALYG